MKKTLRIERLAQKEEKLIIRRIISLSFFSLIIIILLFTLGIPALGKFTDFLSLMFQNKNGGQVSDNSSVIQPPRIDPLPKFTNNTKLNISGYSLGTKVLIFLDSEKAGEVKAEDGKFNFEGLVLHEGENKISAKSISENAKESDFSQTETVIFDKTEPKLEVESPDEGQSFSGDNKIKVLGKTDKDAQVYANGFLASVNLDGNFEVFVPLLEGENTIEVKALDDASNTKIETRKVNFKK